MARAPLLPSRVPQQLPPCQTYPLSTKAIWSWMKTPLFSSPQASGGSAGTRWIWSYLVFSEETGRGEPGGWSCSPSHALLIPVGAALGEILGSQVQGCSEPALGPVPDSGILLRPGMLVEEQ